MKTTKTVLAATALTLLTASSLFAQQRGDDRRRDNSNNNNNRTQVTQRQPSHDSRNDSRNGSSSYRDNQRVNTSGKVTSLSHERDGYRVQLDRGRESYWIPATRMRNHNNLRVGVSIVLGGIFRGGRIDVDAVNWPGDRGSNDNYVRGTVERIDLRSDVLLLRDANTGRTIEVDMRDTRRSSRVDLNDLRRGDFIEVSGDWARGGTFLADRIEAVDGRY
jgi:Ni/Co efflux regulator RcnB